MKSKQLGMENIPKRMIALDLGRSGGFIICRDAPNTQNPQGFRLLSLNLTRFIKYSETEISCVEPY